MNCPVCERKDISPFATHCPSCEADLMAFPLLGQLEENTLDVLKEKLSLEGELTALQQVRMEEKQHYRKRTARMYWFLMLLPLMFFWCGKKNVIIQEDGGEVSASIEALQAENLGLKEKTKRLLMELDSAREQLGLPYKSRQVLHIVSEGETLSHLARKYLGDAERWNQIHELNPQIKDYSLLYPGDSVEIILRKKDDTYD